MTITKRFLRDWETSMHTLLSKSQKAAILERFGTEPEPYTWSEQDICVQIQTFLNHGCFLKPERESSAEAPAMPPGVDF